VGHQVVAPDGNGYYPVGANVGIPGYFDWRGVANGHASDAVAWGWNTVRLTILCTDVVAPPPSDGAIASLVQEYTAKKIVVVIGCWDMTMNNQGDGTSLSDPTVLKLDAFWTRMAQQYKTNPYVWFNAENEPYWTDNAGWVAFQDHFLHLVRAQGAENIFVADVMNAGNDAGWGGARFVYDPSMGPAVSAGQCNVLFSMHNYGGVDDTITASVYWQNVASANLPEMVGEFGYTVDGSSTAGSYRQNLNGALSTFNLAPNFGVGMLWWHATHGDNYSLKQSGNAFYADGGSSSNLSPAGQRLWNVGHAKPNLGRFTGDLRQSHCASAG
jgi:mannan endo-1,4-beta-mannosidase